MFLKRKVGPIAPDVRAAVVAGALDAVFSLKSFAAAMLAYWIALRIGLTRPYWAVTTCYIVAQPLAGAVLSKAAFRIVGTVVGAAVALLIVPNLANAPELLCLALALWLGLCTYFSLLDRTPRAYMALLAGYTAVIISFPVVDAPDTIFSVASVRVQEIVIGISTSMLLHALVLPRSVTTSLLERTAAIIDDAERWSRDALGDVCSTAEMEIDRRRLAIDVHELHQLSIHLPYDLARRSVPGDVLRVLQDRLSLLLPLASAIEDRISTLKQLDRYSADLEDLIGDVRAWLSALNLDVDTEESNALIARARALEPVMNGSVEWGDALRLSMLDRLAELIGAHVACRELAGILVGTRSRSIPSIRSVWLGKRRPLHQDRGVALRGAVGAALTVIVGCAFWIGIAWPDGGGAVVLASIVCALFSSNDDPSPAAQRLLYGTVLAVFLAGLYAFVVLPRVTDIVPLVAVLAPLFLFVGGLMAHNPTRLVGVGIVLTFPGVVGLNASYGSSFSGFANAALAQILGSLLAILMLGLVRTIGTEQVAERLVRAGWKDLARRSVAKGAPDTGDWISRMLDRVGLLTPRLISLGLDPTEPLFDILVDTRVGISVDDLRSFQSISDARDAAIASCVLRSVGRHFAGRGRGRRNDPDRALLRCIDLAAARLGSRAHSQARRQALLALTSLRRNLAPYSGVPWTRRAPPVPSR